MWLPLASSVLPLAFATASAANASDSLFWGTYRPNLYFGLKPRLPESLMTGLIWFGTQDYQSFSSESELCLEIFGASHRALFRIEARHACEQGDALKSYTWTEHDLREGGIQLLKDGSNNIEVTTEWLKVPGGEHGGSWAARISGKPMDTSMLCFHRPLPRPASK
jgi:mannosyl-oligosaccharide glucosidase